MCDPPHKEVTAASSEGTLTFSLHASGQTLLVAAVLAAIPLPLVHYTVLVVSTGVGQVLADRAFEEALAALTAVHPIVFPCKTVRKP